MELFDKKSISALNDWLVEEKLIDNQDPVELKRLLEDSTDSIARGYQLLLQETQQDEPEPNPYQIDPKVFEQLKKKKAFQRLMSENLTLQGVFHYTPEMMANLNRIGLQQFHQRHYEQASRIFLYGLYLNPYVAWFWQGLARCYQGMHKVEDALFAHGMAINCQPLDTDLYKTAVQYCLDVQESNKAKALLEHGLREAQSTPEQASPTHHHQLEAMLAYVNQTY